MSRGEIQLDNTQTSSGEPEGFGYVNPNNLRKQHEFYHLTGYCGNCECTREISNRLECIVCGSRQVIVNKTMNKRDMDGERD